MYNKFTRKYAIESYKSEIKSEDGMFANFYYSVSEKARIKLKEYFPNQIGDDILLQLQDLDENVVFKKSSANNFINLSCSLDNF